MAWRSPSTASTRRVLGQRKRERAEPAEEIGDAPRLCRRRRHEPHHLRLGGRRRLQEGARRQHDVDPAEADGRHRALVDRVAGKRQAREPARLGVLGEPLARRRPEVVWHILDRHVEPVGGERHREPHLGAPRGQRLDEPLQAGKHAHDRRGRHRAFVQVDDVVPLRLEVAEHDAAAGAPRREGRAPPRPGPDGDDVANRRLDAACGEGVDDLLALPGEIRGALQMLQRAAAAMRVVAAHRRHALRRRLQHGDETRAIAAQLDLGVLAREHIRHIDGSARRLGNAVALCAQPCDVERLRITHPCARRAGTPRCPTPQYG